MLVHRLPPRVVLNPWTDAHRLSSGKVQAYSRCLSRCKSFRPPCTILVSPSLRPILLATRLPGSLPTSHADLGVLRFLLPQSPASLETRLISLGTCCSYPITLNYFSFLSFLLSLVFVSVASLPGACSQRSPFFFLHPVHACSAVVVYLYPLRFRSCGFSNLCLCPPAFPCPVPPHVSSPSKVAVILIVAFPHQAL